MNVPALSKRSRAESLAETLVDAIYDLVAEPASIPKT